MKKMTRTEAIRYLKCSGFSDEQIKAIKEGLTEGNQTIIADDVKKEMDYVTAYNEGWNDCYEHYGIEGRNQ